MGQTGGRRPRTDPGHRCCICGRWNKGQQNLSGNAILFLVSEDTFIMDANSFTAELVALNNIQLLPRNFCKSEVCAQPNR